MSSAVKKTGASFWSDNPERYDFDPLDAEPWKGKSRQLARALEHAEVKIELAATYADVLVNAILPMIIAERQPTWLEFIYHDSWKRENADCRLLSGMILRNQTNDVLLFVNGLQLSNSLRFIPLRQQIFRLFGISPEDQGRIEDLASGQREYSVFIDVT